MNEKAQLFYDIGEPMLAGFFEEPEASIAKRFCRAYRRFYENCLLQYEVGATVFPVGFTWQDDMAVSPNFCLVMGIDWQKLEKKSVEAAALLVKEKLWPAGFSHSALNYKRILAEGVNRYEERVRAMRDEDLREALLDVLEGIRAYHRRGLEYLRGVGAPQKLIDALERVPFESPRNGYEAIVALNFMLYFDGYDNIGRVDSILYPYWQGEDLKKEMRYVMENFSLNYGWSVTLGPEYNELTRQWLEVEDAPARPLTQLRLTDELPEDLWDLALKKVLSGGGQPSFFNDKVIMERFRERLPEVREEDLLEFGGMGCTETCFSGKTYSGGVDTNLNVLAVFEKHMHESLGECTTFDEFYEKFMVKLHAAQDGIVNELSWMYRERHERMFAPIRSLFIDDCIDVEKGYYQGGTRYVYAVPAESGIPNTADSLMAIKELVYERGLYSPEDFLEALEAQDPVLKARLLDCPCYGVGNEAADSLVEDLTSRFYDYYSKQKLEMGYDILPTSHQFTRHTEEGALVGATPDGRVDGQALSDSIAALNGKAAKGPTMMLLSASRFSQEKIYGMAVTNLSITRKFDAKVLRALIQGYFSLRGTQLQITCTTKETLLEARKDPEAHRDLIVRVGGYSEYFRNLTDELKDAVIARTMFGD